MFSAGALIMLNAHGRTPLARQRSDVGGQRIRRSDPRHPAGPAKPFAGGECKPALLSAPFFRAVGVLIATLAGTSRRTCRPSATAPNPTAARPRRPRAY